MAKQNLSAIQGLIVRIAQEEGIPPAVALALANQESSFNHLAIGDGGKSTGLFQVNSKAHPDYKRSADPEYQTRYAMRFLKSLLNKHNGNLYKAIRNYNGSGPMADAYAKRYFTVNLPKYDKSRQFGRGTKIAKDDYLSKSNYDFTQAKDGEITWDTHGGLTQRVADIDAYLANKYKSGYVYDASTDTVRDANGAVLMTPEQLSRVGFGKDKYVGNHSAGLGLAARRVIEHAGGDANDPEALAKVKEFLITGNDDVLKPQEDSGFVSNNNGTAPSFSGEQLTTSFDHNTGEFSLGDFDEPTPDFMHLDAMEKLRTDDAQAMYNEAIQQMPQQVDDYINQYMKTINS